MGKLNAGHDKYRKKTAEIKREDEKVGGFLDVEESSWVLLLAYWGNDIISKMHSLGQCQFQGAYCGEMVSNLKRVLKVLEMYFGNDFASIVLMDWRKCR